MKKRNRYGYLFIAPFFLAFFVFSFYPILKTFLFTFTNKPRIGEFEFVGLDNWNRLIHDTMFFKSILNTGKIWGMNIVMQFTLVMILVFIFTDSKWKIKMLTTFRTIYYLPNLITLASVAMLFRVLLNTKYGSINQILMKLNLINEGIGWLEKPFTAQLSVALIQTWMWFGNMFLFLIAGALSIPKDVYEAAAIDGANRFQTFFKVTIPLIKPIMFFILTTSLIGGLQIFEIPMLITDGLGLPNDSLKTMVLMLYNQGFKYNNFGYSSTIAYGIFIITAFFAFINYIVMHKSKDKSKGGVK